MKSSRRGFLKFAGLSAVGVAGSTAVATRTRASEEHEPPATEGKRLALVVDLRKFSKDDALLDKVVNACHEAHNVPDFADDPKNEVKWIWTEDFETAFHEQEFHYIREDLKGKPTLLLCNHCDNPPCTRVCPTQATWKRAIRWGRDDGLASLHRMPILRCRLPVRFAQLQLEGPTQGAESGEDRKHLSNPDAGRSGEVHLLRRAVGARPTARLRRGMRQRRDGFRGPQRPRVRGPAAARRASEHTPQTGPRDPTRGLLHRRGSTHTAGGGSGGGGL